MCEHTTARRLVAQKGCPAAQMNSGAEEALHWLSRPRTTNTLATTSQAGQAVSLDEGVAVGGRREQRVRRYAPQSGERECAACHAVHP